MITTPPDNLGMAIVSAARECLDTLQHQGRRIGQALDCAGVLVHVAQRVGIPFIDRRAYPMRPHKGMMEAILSQQTHLHPVQELQPGDMLLMRFSGEPQHLAVYADSTIIHAYAAVNKCVEHDYTDTWSRRLVRAYRVVL